MSELVTRYDPCAVEAGLDEAWEAAGHYQPEIPSDLPPYCICIPPPNVTGSLHMGHALTVTIQDILCRWKRMSGFNVLWVPGTDHAGIATQMVVERDLRAEGKSRFDLGREGFLDRAFSWKETYRDRIVQQMRRMGVSVDWSRERFTLDPDYSAAVRKVFVTLYKEGLIYQDHRLVNWSSGVQTVLSDLEIDHREVSGHLWHIRYPIVGAGGRSVTVATTRPETLLGDTAVAVHPDDPRHADLIGRSAELPLTGRQIPIIGDPEAVDLEFGTGAVKITPAHDFNDFETGKRNGLPMISIFDGEARLNEEVPEAYRGLDRDAARARVVAELESLGLLDKVEPHAHSVGHCQRSGVVVEPALSTQWFVRIQPMAEPAIQAVRSGAIRFIPEGWEKTYFNWMENIRDWCISRQLWWGHRIPVWTCDDCGEQICEMEDPDSCSGCGGSSLVQDIDVLDTWFSSALWPFASLGWPKKTAELRTFYPNSVMETGFDIIFFWVARMIMSGLRFMEEPPFPTVYLHAMVRDEHGEKMSKTKGNVVDPLDIIDSHGADALRFTLVMLTAQGRDIKLSLARVDGYRAFCNKLWNATRFVLMNTADLDADGYAMGIAAAEGIPEQWIRGGLQGTVQEVEQALQDYRFNEAGSALYQFAWHSYCDWYLELAKQPLRLADANTPERRAVQATLLTTLDTLLRLLHPFMPHITERLWQSLPEFARGAGDDAGAMLIRAPWPAGEDAPAVDGHAIEAQEHVNAVISAVRNIRSERQIPPGTKLGLQLSDPGDDVRAILANAVPHLQALCRLSTVQVEAPSDSRPPEGASLALVASTQVLVLPPADDPGLDEERQRLDKAIAKVEETLSFLRGKLANSKFTERAPTSVVEAERAKLARAEEELARYQLRRSELA